MDLKTKIILILIVIVILFATIMGKLETMAIIIAAIVNIIVLLKYLNNMPTTKIATKTAENFIIARNESGDVEGPDPLEGDFKYSIDNDEFNALKDEYAPNVQPLHLADDNTGTVENRILLAQRIRQNRDKLAIDGAIAKTADYYKHHFDEEFEDSEARVWWEND
jgi:hypothetical protein